MDYSLLNEPLNWLATNMLWIETNYPHTPTWFCMCRCVSAPILSNIQCVYNQFKSMEYLKNGFSKLLKLHTCSFTCSYTQHVHAHMCTHIYTHNTNDIAS